MLNSIEGIYREGHVEFLELPPDVKESRVIVTFLPEKKLIDLRERGIDEQQAADLRARLRSCAADWESPEMDVYDEL